MPVPEGKWEFDVGKLREKGRSVEEMLVGERVGVEDVQREIRRLERLVEAEKKALEVLKKNAKDQEQARKAREKNVSTAVIQQRPKLMFQSCIQFFNPVRPIHSLHSTTFPLSISTLAPPAMLFGTTTSLRTPPCPNSKLRCRCISEVFKQILLKWKASEWRFPGAGR